MNVLAKIMGWFQFGTQALGQVVSSGQTPHGVLQWVILGSSLATAVGIHAASNTANASQVNQTK